LNTARFCCFLLVFASSCSPDKPAGKRPPAAAAPREAAAPPAAPADTLATYTWGSESDMCQFTGRYNPRRYSKAQLDNVHRLMLSGSTMVFTSNATVHRPADLARLSLDTLRAQYERGIKRIRSMRVVPQPTWVRLKKQAIQEIEDDYQAHKLYIEAFRNPAVLLSKSPENCKKYIQGLATQNDSLTLSNWRDFVKEQGQLTGSSEPYASRGNAEADLSEQLLHAKIDLLTYGWFNCVNTTIRRVQRNQELDEQFNRLFTNVQADCEDVD
jgi:hypothetical protein